MRYLPMNVVGYGWLRKAKAFAHIYLVKSSRSIGLMLRPFRPTKYLSDIRPSNYLTVWRSDNLAL